MVTDQAKKGSGGADADYEAVSIDNQNPFKVSQKHQTLNSDMNVVIND